MKEFPECICPLCNFKANEIRRIGGWKQYDGGGGVWLSARCAACDVDFRLSVGNDIVPEWRLDAPDAAQLLASLAPGEFDALSNKLERYQTLRAKWQMFLNRRRDGDEVWRFTTNDGQGVGVTVVRNGLPISRFETFGSLYRKLRASEFIMIERFRALANQMAQLEGNSVEFSAFPSGAAMLHVVRNSRLFVMTYSPSWNGFGVDEVLDGEGFLEKYDFFSHDFAPAAEQLSLLLGLPQLE